MSNSLITSAYLSTKIFACATFDSVELVPNGKSQTGHNLVLLPSIYGLQSSIYPGLIQIEAQPSCTPSLVSSIICSGVNSGFNTE